MCAYIYTNTKVIKNAKLIKARVQWGFVTHQMAVPAPSISCYILNHHNLFYQIHNALAFKWDMCCHLVLVYGYFLSIKTVLSSGPNEIAQHFFNGIYKFIFLWLKSLHNTDIRLGWKWLTLTYTLAYYIILFIAAQTLGLFWFESKTF